MQESLKVILDIQELDMKMIRLMRVKKERQKELQQIEALRKELQLQLTEKEQEDRRTRKEHPIFEQKIQEVNAKIKSLSPSRTALKKSKSSML